nr:immunoglobulin heavy chain junction region [Mus musculus]
CVRDRYDYDWAWFAYW